MLVEWRDGKLIDGCGFPFFTLVDEHDRDAVPDRVLVARVGADEPAAVDELQAAGVVAPGWAGLT